MDQILPELMDGNVDGVIHLAELDFFIQEAKKQIDKREKNRQQLNYILRHGKLA